MGKFYTKGVREERFKNLLIEARKRGFNARVHDTDPLKKENITYKCAKGGQDCILYFMPHEYFRCNTLTDGKGGYILHEGKWAENTTPSFIRSEKMKQLLK
jgi:hypothetical protein